MNEEQLEILKQINQYLEQEIQGLEKKFFSYRPSRILYRTTASGFDPSLGPRLSMLEKLTSKKEQLKLNQTFIDEFQAKQEKEKEKETPFPKIESKSYVYIVMGSDIDQTVTKGVYASLESAQNAIKKFEKELNLPSVEPYTSYDVNSLADYDYEGYYKMTISKHEIEREGN